MLSPVFNSSESAKSSFEAATAKEELLNAWDMLIRSVNSGAINYSGLNLEALSNIEKLELAYRITDRKCEINLDDPVDSLFDESVDSKDSRKLVKFLKENDYQKISDLAEIKLAEFDEEFPKLTAKHKLLIRYMLFKKYDVVLPSPHSIKSRELSKIRFSTNHTAESVLLTKEEGLEKFLSRSLFNSFINLASRYPEPFSLLVNPKFLKELLVQNIISLADFFALHPRRLEDITTNAFPKDLPRAQSTFNAAHNLGSYIRDHYHINKEVELREKAEQIKENLANKRKGD